MGGLLRRYMHCMHACMHAPTNAMHAGWHLDYVEIKDDATGVSYFFPCGKWFDKGEDDRQIERILPVAPRDAKSLKGPYKITVHTSHMKFAGTDANVFIDIHGEK